MAELAASTTDDNPALCCGVCLEPYDVNECIPKFLHCYHSYCLRCITQLSDGKGSLLCPTCRLETVLPPGGAKELRYNFHIDDIKSSILKFTKTSEEGVCSDHQKVLEIWCKTCGIIVCSRCLSAHRSHDVDHIDNLAKECDDEIAEKVCQISESRKNTKDLLEIFKQKKDELNLKLQECDSILQKMTVIRNTVKEEGLSLEDKIEEFMISLAVQESLQTLFQQAISSNQVVQKLHISHNLAIAKKFEENVTAKETVTKERSKVASLKSVSRAFKLLCSEYEDTITNLKDTNNTMKRAAQGAITDHPVMTFGVEGKGQGQFRNPKYITVDRRDNSVYVSDSGNARIQKFDSKFNYIEDFKVGDKSYYPGSLALNEQTNILVCSLMQDYVHNEERKYKNFHLAVFSLVDYSVKRRMYLNEGGNVLGIAISRNQQILCSLEIGDNLREQNCICILNMEGQVLKRIVCGILGNMCIDPNDNIIFVSVGGEIGIVNRYGDSKRTIKIKDLYNFTGCIHTDDHGKLLFTTKTKTCIVCSRVEQENWSYKVETVIDSKNEIMEKPWDLCTTYDGHVLVCDSGSVSSRIFKFKYV